MDRGLPRMVVERAYMAPCLSRTLEFPGGGAPAASPPAQRPRARARRQRPGAPYRGPWRRRTWTSSAAGCGSSPGRRGLGPGRERDHLLWPDSTTDAAGTNLLLVHDRAAAQHTCGTGGARGPLSNEYDGPRVLRGGTTGVPGERTTTDLRPAGWVPRPARARLAPGSAEVHPVGGPPPRPCPHVVSST